MKLGTIISFVIVAVCSAVPAIAQNSAVMIMVDDYVTQPDPRNARELARMESVLVSGGFDIIRISATRHPRMPS